MSQAAPPVDTGGRGRSPSPDTTEPHKRHKHDARMDDDSGDKAVDINAPGTAVVPAGGSAGASEEARASRPFNVRFAEPTSIEAMREHCDEAINEIQTLKQENAALRRRLEAIDAIAPFVDKYGAFFDKFSTIVPDPAALAPLLAALARSATPAPSVAASPSGVPSVAAQKRSAVAVDFPTLEASLALQTSQRKPDSSADGPRTYASAAARSRGPLSEEEYLLFHRPKLPPVSPLVLPNDGSSLLPAVERLYFQPIKRMPFKQLKEMLWKRGVPVQAIASLDYISTRDTIVSGYAILEVVCAKTASHRVVTAVAHFKAKRMTGYKPDQASDPHASHETRKLVKEKYLQRMKAHANRRGTPNSLRRLYGEFFLQSGGQQTELLEVPTDEQIEVEAMLRGDTPAGVQNSSSTMQVDLEAEQEAGQETSPK
ncbi:hypothetical protein JCM11641_000599 [Rhodosporidiobolus odoratus]